LPTALVNVVCLLHHLLLIPLTLFCMYTNFIRFVHSFIRRSSILIVICRWNAQARGVMITYLFISEVSFLTMDIMNCYILIVRLQFVEIKESRTTIKIFLLFFVSLSLPVSHMHKYIHNVYTVCLYVCVCVFLLDLDHTCRRYLFPLWLFL
jgi:hypothetical protein